MTICFCSMVQADDPLDYYPHSVGNKWYYERTSGVPYISHFIKDSIIIADTSTMYFDGENSYKLNSGFIVNRHTKQVSYLYNGKTESGKKWKQLLLLFDFSAKVKERYPRVRQLTDTNGVLKIDSTRSIYFENEYQGKVLGRSVEMRRYMEYFTANQGAGGVLSYYFAKGIGLVLTQSEENTDDYEYLSGFIIGTDTLGDVSKLITSVEEEERQRSDAMAFPNPSSDHIFINTGSMMQREAVIRIVSTSGMEVRPPMRRSATDLYSLDISGLEQGAYTAAVYVGSTVRTVRFAVIR
ncbi:MAG: hypothetical protein JNL32_05125 [Candidatus Kapabacteria bacterium]|nr:hypothetical protein [Candidatus Kapabacteria bacterium]